MTHVLVCDCFCPLRFEMPYNIWCDGCKNHIGMGKFEEQHDPFSYFQTLVVLFYFITSLYFLHRRPLQC